MMPTTTYVKDVDAKSQIKVVNNLGKLSTDVIPVKLISAHLVIR